MLLGWWSLRSCFGNEKAKMIFKKNKIVKDQKAFFNANALLELSRKSYISVFDSYAKKEQTEGFSWLSSCTRLLDYGCGTGTSIDFFYKNNPASPIKFIGVDIADNAIKKIIEKYPHHEFHVIENNQLPLINDGHIDGAYLLHVLHHSYEHQDILNAIYVALAPGGKFFLSDLSSANPLIKGARNVFTWLPSSIKSKFQDDLVVDGSIPDKYPVSIKLVLDMLRACGFKIEKIGYGHLYFFLFDWLERFVPLSRFGPIFWVYKKLMCLEEYLLTMNFFNKRAEVFYVLCRK